MTPPNKEIYTVLECTVLCKIHGVNLNKEKGNNLVGMANEKYTVRIFHFRLTFCGTISDSKMLLCNMLKVDND